MVSDIKGKWNLGEREILSSMRDGISVCVAVVVVIVVRVSCIRGLGWWEYCV